jgi:WD40 repeat protein
MPHDVFISHSSKDKTVADAVCAALENATIRCWVAPRDVQPGRSFAGEIKRAIQNSKVMVLIFSGHSNNSDQVLREVQLAVSSHLHIVQFRIEDVVLNDDLSYFLSTPHWLDALTPPLEAHVGRLTNSVKALLVAPGEVLETTAPPVRLAPGVMARTSGRANVATPAPFWISRASSLWRERKPLVLAIAAVIIFLGWLLLRQSRQVVVLRGVPQYTPPPVRTPQQRPSATYQVPGQTAAPNYVPPGVPDWMRDQMPPSVAPENELAVRRRFILQHEDRVNDASFSADGKRILTASNDKTAQIWDATTGKAVGEPLKHEGEVKKAVFTPDGQRVMTISNSVHFWDSGTQKEIGEPLGAHNLTAASLSPDGKRVAVMEGNSTDQHETRILDVETRQLVGNPIQSKWYAGEHILVFSPDSKLLVTNAGDNAARVWDVSLGKPVGDLLRHKGQVAAASFSPDGKRVATWAQGSKARVWDAQTGEQVLELPTMDAGYRSRICYSPDGKYIAAVRTENYPAFIFDAKTGALHGRQLPYQHPPATFSLDSKRLLTYWSYGGDAVYVWDVETSRLLTKKIQHDGEVEVINFSPDGKWLVTGSVDHTARVWEIGAQK